MLILTICIKSVGQVPRPPVTRGPGPFPPFSAAVSRPVGPPGVSVRGFRVAGPRGGVGREGAGPRGRRGTCFGARADDDDAGERRRRTCGGRASCTHCTRRVSALPCTLCFHAAFVYGPSWKTEPDPSVYTRLAGEGGGRRRGLGGGGALGAKGPGAGSHRPWSQPSLGTGPERLRCLCFMEVHKYVSARFVQDPTSRKLNHRDGLDTASLLWGWNPRLGGGPRARSYGVLNRSPSGTRFYRRPELKGPPFLSLIISCGFRIIP